MPVRPPGRPEPGSAPRAKEHAAAPSAARTLASPPGAGPSGRVSAPAAAVTACAVSQAAPRATPRSQSRTVAAGTCSCAATLRCPRPAAPPSSAAPMTSALQDRRGTQQAGSSTCVRRQAAHRARPGRTQARPPPGTRTLRARALAHGRSTPPQPSCGQRSSPPATARRAAPASTTKITITHLGHPASLTAWVRDREGGTRVAACPPGHDARNPVSGVARPGPERHGGHHAARSSPASRARPASCARWRRTRTPMPARHRCSPQASPDPIQMITGNAA